MSPPGVHARTSSTRGNDFPGIGRPHPIARETRAEYPKDNV